MNIELLGQEPQDAYTNSEAQAFFQRDSAVCLSTWSGDECISVERLYQHFKTRLLAELAKETP